MKDYLMQDHSLILEHPAFRDTGLVGAKGFSLEQLSGLQRIEVTAEVLPELRALGIEVEGAFAAQNVVYIAPEAAIASLRVNFANRGNNNLFLGKSCRLRGSINLEGNNNVFVCVGCNYAAVGINAVLRHNSAGVFLGSGGSSPVMNIWVEGPNKSLLVGEDFLFSWGIWLRTADSHGLVDLSEAKIINHPRSVIVEPHVWLGQDVIVMPGAVIGEGSVIGARSIVTNKIPPCSVAVGSPARVKRRNVSWTRQPKPDETTLRDLRHRYLDLIGIAPDKTEGSS